MVFGVYWEHISHQVYQMIDHIVCAWRSSDQADFLYHNAHDCYIIMKILTKKFQFLSVSEAVQIVDIFRQNISVILPDFKMHGRLLMHNIV